MPKPKENKHHLPRKRKGQTDWVTLAVSSVISSNADGLLNLVIKGGAENCQFCQIGDIKSGSGKQKRINYHSGRLKSDDLIVKVGSRIVAGFTLKDLLDCLKDESRDGALVELKTLRAGAVPKNLRSFLLQRFPSDSRNHELQKSIRDNLYTRTVPCTTRAPRAGEVNGVDYTFLSVPEFQNLEKSGALIESGFFDGNYYGTPRPPKDPQQLVFRRDKARRSSRSVALMDERLNCQESSSNQRSDVIRDDHDLPAMPPALPLPAAILDHFSTTATSAAAATASSTAAHGTASAASAPGTPLFLSRHSSHPSSQPTLAGPVSSLHNAQSRPPIDLSHVAPPSHSAQHAPSLRASYHSSSCQNLPSLFHASNLPQDDRAFAHLTPNQPTMHYGSQGSILKDPLSTHSVLTGRPNVSHGLFQPGLNNNNNSIFSPELPYGWEKVEDPHYGTYYIDHVNKKTQYENPVNSRPRDQPTSDDSGHSDDCGSEAGSLPGMVVGMVSSLGASHGNLGRRSVSDTDVGQAPISSSSTQLTQLNDMTSSSMSQKPFFTRDPSALDGPIISTKLQKSVRGFGFTIVGGDAADAEFLQVKSVVPGGPAYEDGLIIAGDVLVHVNDICVLGYTHQDVVSMFQSIPPGEVVQLQVCRGYPLPFDPEDTEQDVHTTVAVTRPSDTRHTESLLAVSTGLSASRPAFRNSPGFSGGSSYTNSYLATSSAYSTSAAPTASSSLTVTTTSTYPIPSPSPQSTNSHGSSILSSVDSSTHQLDNSFSNRSQHSTQHNPPPPPHLSALDILNFNPAQSGTSQNNSSDFPPIPPPEPLQQANHSQPEFMSLRIVKGQMGFGFTIADSSQGQRVKQIIDRPRCAGMKEGDLLLEINGVGVKNMTHSEVVQVLKDCLRGVEAVIRVQRGGFGAGILRASASKLKRSKSKCAERTSPMAEVARQPARSKTPTPASHRDSELPPSILSRNKHHHQYPMRTDSTTDSDTNSDWYKTLPRKKKTVPAKNSNINNSTQKPSMETSFLPNGNLRTHTAISGSSGGPAPNSRVRTVSDGAELHSDTGSSSVELAATPRSAATGRSSALRPSRSDYNISRQRERRSANTAITAAGPAGSTGLPRDRSYHGTNAMQDLGNTAGDSTTGVNDVTAQDPLRRRSRTPDVRSSELGRMIRFNNNNSSVQHNNSNTLVDPGNNVNLQYNGPYSSQPQHQADTFLAKFANPSFLTKDSAQSNAQSQFRNSHHQQQQQRSKSSLGMPLSSSTSTGNRFQFQFPPSSSLLSGEQKCSNAIASQPPQSAQSSVSTTSTAQQSSSGSPGSFQYRTVGPTPNGLTPNGQVMQNGALPQESVSAGWQTSVSPGRCVDLSIDLDRTETGFGFRIIGGTEEGSQVSVGYIVPGGSADVDGRLQIGDDIIEIQGASVVGASHHRVIQLMAEAADKSQVSLRVRRWLMPNTEPIWTAGSFNPLSAEAAAQRYPFNVTVTRQETEGFGFVILSSSVKGSSSLGGLIGRIIDNSPADRIGCLRVGDRIMAVNGVDVTSLPHEHVVTLIKQSGLSVNLTIGQPLPALVSSGDNVPHTVPTAGQQSNMQQSTTLKDGTVDLNKQHAVAPPVSAMNNLSMTTGAGVNPSASAPTVGQMAAAGEVYEVTLNKGNRGFGFSIRGGREFNSMPLYILRVADTGAAALDGQLRVGDQILQINAINTEGMSHTEAINRIQSGGSSICLLMRRTGKPPPSLDVTSGNSQVERNGPIPQQQRVNFAVNHLKTSAQALTHDVQGNNSAGNNGWPAPPEFLLQTAVNSAAAASNCIDQQQQHTAPSAGSRVTFQS